MMMTQEESKSITDHIEQSFLEMVAPKDVYGYYYEVVAPSIVQHMEDYGQDDVVEYTDKGLPVTARDIHTDGRRIARKYI